MSDAKQAFGALSGEITWTLGSLANGSARESGAIDNTAGLFFDAQTQLAFALAAGAPVSELALYLWFSASVDGTNWSDNATGSDAALTMRTPSNLFGPRVIATPTGGVTYRFVVPSVAAMFGGVMPAKWSMVLENRTGLSLAASGHSAKWLGVYSTAT